MRRLPSQTKNSQNTGRSMQNNNRRVRDVQDTTANYYLPLLKQINLNMPSKFYQKPDADSQVSQDLRYILHKLSESKNNNLTQVLSLLQMQNEQANLFSFDDLAHALYLIKVYSAYPRNYQLTKFTESQQLILHLREKEMQMQLWNKIKPCLEQKKVYKYANVNRVITWLVQLLLPTSNYSFQRFQQSYESYITMMNSEEPNSH